jgi:DNA polymerase
MEEIMGRAIDWAPGLPLRADGFITDYYMKEID